MPPGACASFEALTFIKLKSLTIECMQEYYLIATESTKEYGKIKALLFRKQISFSTKYFDKQSPYRALGSPYKIFSCIPV